MSFNHMSRDKNQFINALAILAAMTIINCEVNVQPFQIEAGFSSAYYLNIKAEPNGQPQYYDIRQYIKTREYPLRTSKADKKNLQRLFMNFFLNREVIYKRSFSDTLLRCVDTNQTQKIISELYEGVCITHANGHMMAHQAL